MSTTTAAEIACPAWCTETPGEHECTTLEGLPVHSGPDFDKRVSIQRAEGEPFEAIVWITPQADGVFVKDPAELRRAARAMVAAAEWIETNGGQA